MRSDNQQLHLKARLTCLAVAMLGLALVFSVLNNVDSATAESTLRPQLAAPPTPSRTIAAASLQAEGLPMPDVAVPVFMAVAAGA